MQQFRDTDLLSSVRISQLNWIGQVNRMDSKRKVSPVLNTLRTGHLNCLNPRSRALNTVIQLLYFVSLKIHNKFTDDYLGMRSRSYKHLSAVPFGGRLHVLRN
jgi:hypothetical protein